MMNHKFQYIGALLICLIVMFDAHAQTDSQLDYEQIKIQRRERQDSLLEARKQAIVNEINSQVRKEPVAKVQPQIQSFSISGFNVQTASLSNLDLERTALIELYDSLGGESWKNQTNWKSELPVGQWFGVTVDGEGYVTSIYLPANGLQGKMPEEIANFSRLRTLNLYLNNLGENGTNSFPHGIVSLTTLTYLDLSFNDFIGQIPDGIGNLLNMTHLYLHYNSFNGAIPSSIGYMSQLSTLDLRSNSLSGPIPDSFANLINLRTFAAWYNPLNSDIPDIFGNMGKLETLYLQNCGLSGDFPQSIQYATSLFDLDLSNNKITGELPDLNNYTFIGYVILNDNLLEGSLPDISDFLGEMDVSNNLFSGEIPEGMYYNGQGGTYFFGNQFTHVELVPYLQDAYARGGILCWPQDSVMVPKPDDILYGLPYSLEILVDRDPTLECKFQWFKYVDGVNDIPLQAELAADNHTYTFENFALSDTGYYYFHIEDNLVEGSYDWSNPNPYHEVVSHLIHVQGSYPDCVELPLDFNHYPAPTCGVLFTPEIENENDCEIVSYHWDFGDGNSSLEQEPHHVYSTVDTFRVTLKVAYDCFDLCGALEDSVSILIDLREDIFDSLRTVIVETLLADSVLSASSASFSDNWYVPYDNEQLRNRHPYLNGSKGVWRNNASFVFREDRRISSTANVAQDGTYQLESFNWANAQYEAIPGWLKTNTITRYSPYSYELENQDILGNYSAALYSYGGQMPVAVGQNMANEEMAFTGFEELDVNGFAIVDAATSKGSGNWSLSAEDQEAVLKEFEVHVGIGNLALVSTPIETFNDIDSVDVFAVYTENIKVGFLTIPFAKFKRLDKVAIMCKESYGAFDEMTILTFDQVVHDDFWIGSVKHSIPAKRGTVSDISDDIAHTGGKSLKITADKVLKQKYLDLIPGKEYMLSAWASVNDKHLYAPVMGNELGIILVFYDNTDTKVGEVFVEPEGNIIEGWQKLEARFIYPRTATQFEVSFENGTASVLYFDDLRLFPSEGNMQTYVYELDTYRLKAVMDENNFASLYYYDPEGNLYLVKKETEKGLRAIQESVGYQKANSK